VQYFNFRAHWSNSKKVTKSDPEVNVSVCLFFPFFLWVHLSWIDWKDASSSYGCCTSNSLVVHPTWRNALAPILFSKGYLSTLSDASFSVRFYKVDYISIAEITAWAFTVTDSNKWLSWTDIAIRQGTIQTRPVWLHQHWPIQYSRTSIYQGWLG